MKKTEPVILVIVGVTGDLAKRKLLPAVEEIAAAGELPENFRVLGITRQDITADKLAAAAQKLTGKKLSFVAKHLDIFQMDLKKAADYARLKQYLYQLSKPFGAPSQELFYLAIPPQVTLPVIKNLGKVGFAAQASTKLLLEKPFGTDLTSARALIKEIQHYFSEDQIYRIDHYLAKEMAQNLLVFRGGNSLFKNTWSNKFIEKIEIIASEKIGIEGRSVFYEQTGALRDVVQSHLLQLAALTLMELPVAEDLSDIPAKRFQALKALQPPARENLGAQALRAQYASYTKEVNNPTSLTETFVSLILFSDDPRWRGVPITLTTGKMLDRKTTEIRISYKKARAQEANELVLRLQPYEGISFDFWSKRPGYNRELDHVPLSFTYADHFDSLPEAYEKVLVDAIHSDHSLFTSSAEVLASWKVLEPIQRYWQQQKALPIYKTNSSIDQVLKAAL